MDAADILPYEQIHVWDVTNGNRLITYALEGDRGSGVVQVNGGGAHKVKKGDVVIIATFTMTTSKRAKRHKPRVVFVDAKNRQRRERAPDPKPSADGPVAKPRRRAKV